MKGLASARKRSGKTQAETAKALGLDASTVAKWETEVSEPKACMLPDIAKFFGCAIEDLYKDNTKAG